VDGKLGKTSISRTTPPSYKRRTCTVMLLRTCTSLVPRPEKGRRNGPGFHCLRMRLIAVEFHGHRGRSIHVRTLVTSKRIPIVTWSVQVIVVMACVSTDLNCALSYALQRLGTPNLILKSEQRSVIESICNGKDTFVWLPTDLDSQ